MGVDHRIELRLNAMVREIEQAGSSVVNKSFKRWSDKIAAYRALNNDRYTLQNMIDCLTSDCARKISPSEHILCLEDTSEFDFRHIGGRLKEDDPDIGVGGTSFMTRSFFLHPVLAVNADSGDVSGFSSIEFHNRCPAKDMPKKKIRKANFKDRESYRWLSAAENSVRNLPKGTRITMVCDREGDAFDIMHGMSECGCDFVIRSNVNRVVVDEGKRLRDVMDEAQVISTFELEVKKSIHHKAHRALMTLKYKKITIPSLHGSHMDVWCVLVSECPSTVPRGEEPVTWRLLTSHEVASIEDALNCVRWYKMRWTIEELFRVLKSKGFDVGGVQLETGKAIKKLLILTMQASLNIMQLKQAMDEKREDIEASVVLAPVYVTVLSMYMNKWEGQARRNKGNTNPFKRESLPWAAWIIARLGGWSGYESAHGKPGRISLCNGYTALEKAVEFFLMTMENVYKD